MAVEPGGIMRFVMVGPKGEEYQNRIEYDEVVPPARLTYIHGSDEEPEQFRVTVTLDAVGNSETQLVMEMRFPSAADLDNALEYGDGEGATQSLDRLGDHLTGGTPAES